MDLTTILIVLAIIVLVIVLVLIARRNNKKNVDSGPAINERAEAGGNPQAAEKAPPHEEAYGTEYVHKEDFEEKDLNIPEAAEGLKDFDVQPNAWCAGDTCQIRIAYKHADSGNFSLTLQPPGGGSETELATDGEFEKVYKPGEAPFNKEGEYVLRLKKDGLLIGEEHLYALSDKGGTVKVHSHVVMPVQTERKRILAKNTVVLSQFTTGKDTEFTICSKGAVLTGITLLPEGRHAMCGTMELSIRRKSELVMEYGELEPGEYQELTPAAPIDQGIHLNMTQYCGDDEFPAGDVVSWTVELTLECGNSGKIEPNPEKRETEDKD